MSDPIDMGDLDSLPYEELYRQLEETVRRLESGDLPLAEALACYDRGMQLAAACQRLLDRAELRIQRVAAVVDGAPIVEPWE
ncbi:MAG: hypothetical protein KatS3mg057_2558 [Herpetosiphonaceae bacterium]|nr:MAG: hypothetical protein KatS3mg057_2558 [Herpetosiphonaceae bacterium]